jgi:hypothetical protein
MTPPALRRDDSRARRREDTTLPDATRRSRTIARPSTTREGGSHVDDTARHLPRASRLGLHVTKPHRTRLRMSRDHRQPREPVWQPKSSAEAGRRTDYKRMTLPGGPRKLRLPLNSNACALELPSERPYIRSYDTTALALARNEVRTCARRARRRNSAGPTQTRQTHQLATPASRRPAVGASAGPLVDAHQDERSSGPNGPAALRASVRNQGLRIRECRQSRSSSHQNDVSTGFAELSSRLRGRHRATRNGRTPRPPDRKVLGVPRVLSRHDVGAGLSRRPRLRGRQRGRVQGLVSASRSGGPAKTIQLARVKLAEVRWVVSIASSSCERR